MARTPKWITEAREVVDRASDVTKLQTEFDAMNDFRVELGEVLRELASLVEGATLGRGTWWHGLDAPAELYKDLHAAQKLKMRQLKSLERVLEQYRLQVREAVKRGWRDHVESATGNARELQRLVKVLTNVQDLEEVAAELETLLARLTVTQRNAPDAGAVQLLARVTELMPSLEQRLPTAVRIFVATATRGGAGLELYNAEVRDWLAANDALHNFKVLTGRPTGGSHA